MRVTIKYIASLQTDGLKEQIRTYPPGIRVREIVADLQLEEELLGMTLLNGHYAEPESIVKNGDILSLLPLVDGG